MSYISKEKIEKLVEDGYISSRKHPSADLYILNYTPKTQYDKYWTEETLQCRGLIVDKDGKIVARPFKKFFNVEEMESVPNEPFEVYEKVDGSLGITYFIDGKPYIATRGSFESPQAIKANEILYGMPAWKRDKLRSEITYLFEIVYPQNRIVVDYKGLNYLIFLAAIVTETGEELSFDNVLKDLNWIHGALKYNSFIQFHQIKNAVSRNDEDNFEGFVVRFKSGVRCKMKYDEYKRRHKILTQTSNISIWESLRDGKSLDEILDRIPDEFYNWVRHTKDELEKKFKEIEDYCAIYYIDYKGNINDERKKIAEYFKKSKYPGILFAMYDAKDYKSMIWKLIRPQFSKPFEEDTDEC